ncbi:MAG: CDP-diacylglycerol--glycerol-3-phosphate 3-phosphatidyltransferase [Steroidobacteraceae bacterium]
MNGPYTIPNLLTAIRIALIPAIVVLFYLPYHWADMACGVAFALVGITDAFDGYLARKLGQVSRLGAFLDPVADKLIVATALVLIVSKDPTWYVTLTAAVIIGREIAISALREWMAEIGARHKMKVSGVAKFKTIVQIVGLSMMLFRQDLFGLPIYQFGLGLTVLAAVLTLWSMVAYLHAAGPDLRGSGQT